MKISSIQSRLRKLSDPKQAKLLQGFFKTGPGEYGEGDIFLGIKVPQTRAVAKEFYKSISLKDLSGLIRSKYHEERLLALIILVLQYPKAPLKDKERIYKFYLANTRYINNWDLVDLSALYIVGAFLADKDRSELYRLAKSALLWDRRIAILATFHFIRNNDFADSLALAEIFIPEKEDLMHKASGWMLREIGKRDIRKLEAFLDKHATKMPRTMLRYAIEKFPDDKRQHYLHK
jgi:3-methyladenine DNA glycosylase AlkD